jgi:hypothetical protein
LPGSLLKNNTSTDQITLINNKVKFVNLTSDISCKAFNGKNAEPQLCPNHTRQINIIPKAQLCSQLCPNPISQNSPNHTTQNITPKAGKQQQFSEDRNPRDKGQNAYYGRVY